MSLLAYANFSFLNVLTWLYAQSQVTLPTVGDSYIDRVIGIIQKYVDLSTGAVAMTLAAVGLIAAIALWFLSPREGFVGTALKIVAFGVFVLNVPVILRALQFS